MNTSSLPLYQLFIRLRNEGFPLGISDYNLLLETLLSDNSSELLEFDLTSVKLLCRTLWVKSLSQKQKFEAIFAELMMDSPTAKALILSTDKNRRVTQPLPTKPKKPSEPKIPSSNEYFFFPPKPSELEPESDVVKSLKTRQRRDWISFKPSGIENEYLPVTAEQMQQELSQLRHPLSVGSRRELDINATIEKIQRQGKPQPPILKFCQVRPQLVLFLDQRGSMQPFQVLSRLLKETALRVGCLATQHCYYFYNYPIGEFYNDPDFAQVIPFPQMIGNLHPQKTIAIIFSDGGAARGYFSQRRFNETRDFISQLRLQVRALCWLKTYWRGTTAAQIAQKIIPMFPIDQKGFHSAIQVLK